MKKRGRPKIGAPISITLTDEQRAWLEKNIPPGSTLTAFVRAIIQGAIDHEKITDDDFYSCFGGVMRDG